MLAEVGEGLEQRFSLVYFFNKFVIAGTAFGVRTLFAFFVAFADAKFGSQIVAFASLRSGGDGVAIAELLFAIDILRGDLHRIEKTTGALCVDAIVDEGI